MAAAKRLRTQKLLECCHNWDVLNCALDLRNMQRRGSNWCNEGQEVTEKYIRNLWSYRNFRRHRMLYMWRLLRLLSGVVKTGVVQQ
jgi:hypothetical protein